MYDFHTHTTLSDRELIPTELIRRRVVAGYAEMAVIGHTDFST